MKCRLLSLRLIIWHGVVRLGVPFDPAAARNGSIWLLECRLAAGGITGDHYALSGDKRLCRCTAAAGEPDTPHSAAREYRHGSPSSREMVIGFRFVPSQRPAGSSRYLSRS
jgi:hypothetical protein